MCIINIQYTCIINIQYTCIINIQYICIINIQYTSSLHVLLIHTKMYYMLFSYQTGYIMWHSQLRIYIPWGAAEGNIHHAAVLSIKTAFNLVKIHLLFCIIPLIQWSIMFCHPCFNLFWGLKYILRLFSEYMQTFRAEEPMKTCVTN